MARWLLDEEPSEVFAWGSCLVDKAIGEADDIDTARTLLKTASGRLCVIANSRRSGFGYDQRIEAYGSAGMVRADNVAESTVEVWTEDSARADRFPELPSWTGMPRRIGRRWTILPRSSREGCVSSGGVWRWCRAFAPAAAAARSLALGGPVSL